MCQQLGLIYNPDHGTATLRMVAPVDTRVLMSWVFCDETDEDLTQCRAIKGTEVGCDHEKDVYLRCQEPTWAGKLCFLKIAIVLSINLRKKAFVQI